MIMATSTTAKTTTWIMTKTKRHYGNRDDDNDNDIVDEDGTDDQILSKYLFDFASSPEAPGNTALNAFPDWKTFHMLQLMICRTYPDVSINSIASKKSTF